ncbi:MAG: RNA polymerase-associated protein RapA [Candidatus Sericytochromatia bacterium]|nr:RNA polymerase-associated protein RapA [Candidatus Sericytochromatia bacterium]
MFEKLKMEEFVIGQRWISETEPELGLGIVLSVSNRIVEIKFATNGNVRNYAIKTSPLKRVVFKLGDLIKSKDGKSFNVEEIHDNQGVLTYKGNGIDLNETEVSDSMSFTGAEERLFSGQIDENRVFNLRYETLMNQSKVLKSDIRGFVAPRVSLLPHQLYIAHEVANRYSPRVLLADEVGLGKTIEAGLIIHQMLHTERASRILIITPDSLVNQWFVEMLRKFNITFNILDEDICSEIETTDPDSNPFTEYQLVICSIDFLVNSLERQNQVLESDWDLFVVDEAHHLTWSEDDVSIEYDLVEELAYISKGVLLLTATPEQLGISSHFARLRLLDPDRFYDLKSFIRETEDYKEIAGVVNHLINDKSLTDEDKEILMGFITDDDLDEQMKAVDSGDQSAINKIIESLVDQHGTGRVLFRNTRAAMSNFPKRIPLPVMLEADLKNENEKWWKDDPRIDWIVKLLQDLDKQKVLLICAAKQTVLDLEEILRDKSTSKTAVFHEGLSLIARDRNAAYFSEENGASILLCSEIGSEGRNFQFSHNLVLFDLPRNPDLLEQRIGRLDRIGQKYDINIHIPYLKNTDQHILFEIYNNALSAFEHSIKGGAAIFHKFRPQINQALSNPIESLEKRQINNLVEEMKIYSYKLAEILENGRDRLLEFNSFKPEIGNKIVEKIKEYDDDTNLEDYMNDLFAHFGVDTDDISETAYTVTPGENMFVETFPGISPEGTMITYNRSQALEREDMKFLTWEHPIVTSSIDLFMSSEHGNSAVGKIENANKNKLVMEAIFVLECIAPQNLQADRFLPPTPIRILINNNLQEEVYDYEDIKYNILEARPEVVFETYSLTQESLQRMVDQTKLNAEKITEKIIKMSNEQMIKTLSYEAKRLISLKEINPNVTDDEIDFAKSRITDLNGYINNARLRLDCVRLISFEIAKKKKV